MVKKIFAQTYLWVLLLLLYSPIVIIVIYSFTEAKVLGNWTGFSTKLYSSLFNTGAHHSLMNALINTITIALLAATASTLLGSIAAIGIFNLKARSRKAIGFVNSIPIRISRNHAGIYHSGTGAHHFLYSLRRIKRSAAPETNESEHL